VMPVCLITQPVERDCHARCRFPLHGIEHMR
jgi:hypothetical protein